MSTTTSWLDFDASRQLDVVINKDKSTSAAREHYSQFLFIYSFFKKISPLECCYWRSMVLRVKARSLMPAKEEIDQMTYSPTSTSSFKSRMESSQPFTALSEAWCMPWWYCVEVAQMITQSLGSNKSHSCPNTKWLGISYFLCIICYFMYETGVIIAMWCVLKEITSMYRICNKWDNKWEAEKSMPGPSLSLFLQSHGILLKI